MTQAPRTRREITATPVSYLGHTLDIPTHVGAQSAVGRGAALPVCVVPQVALLLLLGWALTGCQGMYFLTDPNKEKTIKAEYSKIGDCRVAVVVWCDQATLDMFARVRYQVGKSVTFHLREHLPHAKFIDQEEVRKLQERDSGDWENTPVAQLCERLECDLILRVDLLEFTTRAAETKELRKGRIRGTVIVYDGDRPDSEAAMYDTDVAVTYPPQSLHGVPDMEETEILHETVELFGQTVAKKFYEHGESLRGPEDR